MLNKIIVSYWIYLFVDDIKLTNCYLVGYIGELNDLTLTPNPDEVEQLFSVPLADLLDKNKWVIRDFSTPVFTGKINNFAAISIDDCIQYYFIFGCNTAINLE